MAYGNTYEEAKAGFSHPAVFDDSDRRIIHAINEPEFSLACSILKKGASSPMYKPGVLYVESGSLNIDGFPASAGRVIEVPNLGAKAPLMKVEENARVYFFTGPEAEKIKFLQDKFTSDVRDKYWGKIETIVSREFSGKRIFMKAGTLSSLEYHVHKKESYYLQQGKLRVGVRVGRAENRAVILNPGDAFIMPPGLMHMRIAEEDCVIIEASTKDEDSDSHIVEDGQKLAYEDAIKTYKPE